MRKEIFTDEKLGESYIKAVHPSGLTVYICEKPAYASAYALFGTRYGSIDTRFRVKGGDWVDVPEGIAHFLEHKLFESEEGDAFTRYAETGAYANAYTSFDRTCYLFSCSGRFEDSFDILLDFVQSPYFTKETVDKEQGIIGQEIRMYDDSPDWRVLFNLLTAMYENHPVRIDIAGTVESIAKIDHELLYTCYNTFYNPANMFICVAGKVDADKVLAQIDRSLKNTTPVEVERGRFTEPDGVVKQKTEQRLAVSIPLFCYGFKEKCGQPEKSLADKVHTNLLLELAVGEASPLYNRLLAEGLINKNFGAEYFTGHGYAAPIFQGESKDPDKVAAAIAQEFLRLKAEGIDPDAFEGVRRKLYGRSVMRYNDVESLASGLTEAAMHDAGLFDELELYRTAAPCDLEARLAVFDPEKAALSVILPMEE